MFELEQKNDALQKVYLLCEEKEEDGIREFQILAIGREKADLIPLMEAKLEKDEFGLFGANGVEYHSDTAIQSQYNEDGAGVEYYILEEPLLSKEHLQAKLQTHEYETAFRHPDNLDGILTSVFRSMVDNNYPEPDIQKVANHVMKDKSFQSMIKRAWWASDEHIDERTSKFATNAIYTWLQDHFRAHPNFFKELGAHDPFICSEALRNLLIDIIYDVSKEYRLFVNSVDSEADRLLAKADFRAKLRSLTLIPQHSGSDTHEALFSCCWDYVESQIVPEEKRAPKRPSIDQLLSEANTRKANQSSNFARDLENER